MYRKRDFLKIFLLIISLTIIIACKKESSNSNQQDDDNNLYKNIGEYINANREKFLGNGLKGIDFYRLIDEQEIFYHKRLDFFIAILNNDEQPKIEYYKYAKEYYRKFPENAEYYYFWSKDVLDYRLYYHLKEQFGVIKLPMEYMEEYYQDIDMFKGIDE